MTRRGGLTRNRIFTDGLLSYIKRPGRACSPRGAGGRQQGKVAGAARGPSRVIDIHRIQRTVVKYQIPLLIVGSLGKLLRIAQPGAGFSGGAGRAGRAGRTRGAGRTCRAVYLCTTLDFPLC